MKHRHSPFHGIQMTVQTCVSANTLLPLWLCKEEKREIVSKRWPLCSITLVWCTGSLHHHFNTKVVKTLMPQGFWGCVSKCWWKPSNLQFRLRSVSYSVRPISAHNLTYLSFSCALTSFVGSLREWSITSASFRISHIGASTSALLSW